MTKVLIAGAGLTAFGRQPGRGIRSLSVEAIDLALADAGAPAADVQRVFFGNAVAGVVTQQEMIRGQVALRHHGLARVPLINVENACASGGTALHLAYEAVRAGQFEVVMVVGVEQMNHADKSRPFNALHGSTDVEEIGEYLPGVMATHSILMGFYAGVARKFLEETGASAEDFGRVAVKNRQHAMANPIAQFRTAQTLEEVMAARLIVAPLTLPMCAPTTDGAGALLVCSEAYARKVGAKAVRLLTSQISGSPGPGRSPVAPAARMAYEATGLGPKDFDLIELHDAAAPAELLQYSEIGLCIEGEAHHLIRSGATQLGGKIPVNTSGGLLSRGHALGATGCAQVAELFLQLRGQTGARQVQNARTGLAINGGGWLADTYALTVATILQAL
ncbi:MAG: thiolase family protein [Panacagrimonas sp.]